MAKRSSKAATPPGPAPRLSRRQRVAWLRLIRSENVGPATFRALVNEFGGAEAAIAALPVLSRRGGRAHDIRLYTEADAEAELERAEHLGASLVALGEPGYPRALAEVDAPPPLLYLKGRFDLADIPIVAIVGARNGSAVGQKFTRQLAGELGWRASSSPRGSRVASIRQRIAPHWSMEPSPCSPAASISFTRRRTKICNMRLPSAASSSASDLPASHREDRISPGATG